MPQIAFSFTACTFTITHFKEKDVALKEKAEEIRQLRLHINLCVPFNQDYDELEKSINAYNTDLFYNVLSSDDGYPWSQSTGGNPPNDDPPTDEDEGTFTRIGHHIDSIVDGITGADHKDDLDGGPNTRDSYDTKK